jgi:NADH-quinone oxidoreductase subunit J
LVAVVSAWRVVSAKHLVHAILWLVVTFFSTACLFVMLGAEFLAAIQVLVYAGAIIILYVFAIMLVNPKDAKTVPQFHRRKGLALWIGGLIFIELGFMVLPRLSIIGKKGNLAAEAARWGGNSELIGKSLYTDYILPFEIVSVILLVAIIGAVVLAVRRSQ